MRTLAKLYLFALLTFALIDVVPASASNFSLAPDSPDFGVPRIDLSDITTAGNSLSSRAAVFPPPFPVSIIQTSGNFTLSGAPGETVTLNLKDFVLGGTASFTLEGTATTRFVINVSRKFSLSGNAAITLGDGVDVANVLFNVKRKGSVIMKGNSWLQGRLSAPARTLTMSQNAHIYGWANARKILIRNSAMIEPPVVSP